MNNLLGKLTGKSLAKIVARESKKFENSPLGDKGLNIRQLFCWTYHENERYYATVSQHFDPHAYAYKGGPFFTENEAEAHLAHQIKEALELTPSARFIKLRRKNNNENKNNSHEIVIFKNGNWIYEKDY